jgi:general secretion pathway protein I
MWNTNRTKKSLSQITGSRAPFRGRRGAAGFTLLEVMVAIAILATAFTAALRLHSDSMGALISARIHTKAAELAQFKMTEFEMADLNEIRMTSGDFGDLAPDYVWAVQVENTPAELWKKVTVRVANKHGGRTGEFELTEYMSDKALIATFKKPEGK